MTKKIKFAAALALMLQTAAAFAAVPGLINFQGRLLDANKLPRTGSFTMIFNICSNPSGACTSLWNETQSVTVTNGVFAVQLGASTPITPGVFSTDTLYLDINVGGEALLPRERLIAGAYSFRAGVADSLASNSGSITLTGGITASSGTFTNTAGAGLVVSSSAYLASAGGKVGIGTTNPGEALEVNGNIKVGSATGGTVRGTTELVLRQDGDTYGATALRLRNRNGENGAIFDASEATVALVDFIFKDSSEQRNIRYESRAGSAKAGAPSFHIGGGSGGTANPDAPTLAVGDTYAAVASKLAVGSYNSPTQNFDVTGNSYFSGNVGIGLAPSARLTLPAGTAAAGTAPLKLTSGANLGTTEAGAVEFDGSHLYFTAANAGLRYQLDQQPGTPLTIAAIGSVPNANGMSLSSQQLNLQPADATYGGVVTTGAQIFAGAKTFNSAIIGDITGNAETTTKTNDLATAVSVYPVWATSAASNMADKVSTTKLSFIPNTGILSATGFAGSGASLTTLSAGNISAGTLASARGGTGADLSASAVGAVPYFSATGVMSGLAAGSANQLLRSAGGAAPTWTTATYPNTTTINQLLYSNAANAVTGLATANSGVLVTGASGIPAIGTDLPTAVTIGGAYVYRANGTDIPISDGGTGAATQTAAFNALSPTTTKGDVIVDDGTNAIRLGVGANNQVLTADSTQASGLKWTDPVISNFNSKLAADVALGTAGTWYNGPSVALPAGTWLVMANVTFVKAATTVQQWFARITDNAATTYYASGQAVSVSNNPQGATIALTTVITLAATTTIKIQATGNPGIATALMKAATASYGSGNNATQITAIALN